VAYVVRRNGLAITGGCSGTITDVKCTDTTVIGSPTYTVAPVIGSWQGPPSAASNAP
jgi:hypothetical protein